MKQIKGEDDYADSSDENSSSGDEAAAAETKKSFIDSQNKFGVKALKTKKSKADPEKELDAEQVLKAARRVTGAAQSDQSDNDSDIEQQKPKPTANTAQEKKKTEKKKVGFTTVEFGDDDLKDFNAEKGKLIKERDMDDGGAAEDSKDAE